SLDIANVQVTNARVSYTDAQAGSSFSISNLSLETGRIAGDLPFEVDAEFDFEAEPGEMGGHLAINGTTTLGSAFDRLELRDWNIAGQLAGIAEEPTNLEFSAGHIVVDMDAETVTTGEMD